MKTRSERERERENKHKQTKSISIVTPPGITWLLQTVANAATKLILTSVYWLFHSNPNRGGGSKSKREKREGGDEKEVGGGGGYACHHNYQQVHTNKGSTSVQSSLV